MAEGAGAAAAAIAQAVKASGVVLRVRPEEFLKILGRNKDPLVAIAEGGFFSKKYSYLTSYKGLAFFTKSSEALMLPTGTEIVVCDRIWIPG